MRLLKVAIFASGTGSNALALIKKAKTLSNLEISFVLSDKESAPVLSKAQAEDIKTYLMLKTGDRTDHELQILQVLKEHHVDWILLAGYMRLLSISFLETFAKWHRGASQVVNIHPSLLPLYPGKGSLEKAHQDRVSHTGVTLHLVDEGMDTGKIIKQEKLQIFPQESLIDVSQRMHQLEHQIYTEFLASLSTGQQQTHYFEESFS